MLLVAVVQVAHQVAETRQSVVVDLVVVDQELVVMVLMMQTVHMLSLAQDLVVEEVDMQKVFNSMVVVMDLVVSSSLHTPPK